MTHDIDTTSEFKPRYTDDGLIPAIAVDFKTSEVLMMAWMNADSLDKTISTGIAHYWSRSRQKLWKKGETSGNIQIVKEILVDCDQDTLLIKIEQVGNKSCHTGRRSCFYRILTLKSDQSDKTDPSQKLTFIKES